MNEYYEILTLNDFKNMTWNALVRYLQKSVEHPQIKIATEKELSFVSCELRIVIDGILLAIT